MAQVDFLYSANEKSEGQRREIPYQSHTTNTFGDQKINLSGFRVLFFFLIALSGRGEEDHDVYLILKLVLYILQWETEEHLGNVQKIVLLWKMTPKQELHSDHE